MYKKLLVILHDSILPHMSKPTLMIDFLTAAYEVGEFSVFKLMGVFQDKTQFRCNFLYIWNIFQLKQLILNKTTNTKFQFHCNSII